MLETIVASVREEISRRSRAEWEREINDHLTTRTPKPVFSKAITANGENFIFEIKRKAPSSGPLKPQVDVVSTAINYARNGAAAISVLTEQQFFGGTCADLRLVNEVVEVPTIRKDFVVDRLQVLEAAANGASAVLLIAAILSDEELGEFRRVAEEVQIEALVEVHDGDELDRALKIGALLVGVNNRNLKTMQIDIENGVQILRKIPHGVIKVAESGIRQRSDVERLRDAGANAYLIGTSLMQSENPSEKIRELRGL